MKQLTLKLSRKLKSIAKGLDKKIEKVAGERIAFTLIVYTDGRASYVSTCPREVSVTEIEKLLKLWREGMPDIAAHEIN